MSRVRSNIRSAAHALLAGLWLIVSVSASAYAIVETPHGDLESHAHASDHTHDLDGCESHAPCKTAPCHVHWLAGSAPVSVFSPRYAAPAAGRLSDTYASRGDPPGRKPPMS